MKFLIKTIFTLFLLLLGAQMFAQQVNLERIDPPFWWAGMKNSNLQLMVYGENISSTKPTIIYEGIHLEEVIQVESPNYLFLNIVIDEITKQGTFDI